MENTKNGHTYPPLFVQSFHTGDMDDLFQNVFRAMVAARGLPYVRQANWRSEEAFAAAMNDQYLRPDDVILADMRDECDLRLTLERSGNVVQLFACAKYHAVSVAIAGSDPRAVMAGLDEHSAMFSPTRSRPEPNRPSAKFAFWYAGEKGPEREEKELAVPSWSEIRGNYASRSAAAVDQVVARFNAGAGGRLMLWHGAPGTGKTFAIRALAWEWRDRCRFEYVIDPENLFGPRADYLARIALDGSGADDESGARRWRLLVLEDTGELLSVDAKERAGQGLSRLLNAVDGLLGQGSRVLLLITTNEELGTLHPAVTRPGRCASQIEFLPLPAAESKAWLAQRSCIGEAPKVARTIAELYATLAGRSIPERSSIGFSK